MAHDQPVDGRGRLISRYEIFDEADLDAALARFETTRRRGGWKTRQAEW